MPVKEITLKEAVEAEHFGTFHERVRRVRDSRPFFREGQDMLLCEMRIGLKLPEKIHTVMVKDPLWNWVWESNSSMQTFTKMFPEFTPEGIVSFKIEDWLKVSTLDGAKKYLIDRASHYYTARKNGK